MSSPRVNPARFLSDATRLRPFSAIRALFPAELEPGMLSLLAGKPNPDTFPYASISLTLKTDAESGIDPTTSQPVKLDITGAALSEALQYGATCGINSLVTWITELQTKMHARQIVRPGDQLDGKDGRTPWRVTVGVGSQDLLNKTFEALLNPGDVILVENPVYTGILPALTMLKAKVVPVPSDSEGASASELERIMAEWHTSPLTRGLAPPKCLYTTPTGANPAGTTASDDRKRAILSTARKYDFLILEDDPYYYINFTNLDKDEDPVTRVRSRSYWSLEEEGREVYGTGRVIRFESFSKILSAGLRLGFAVGPTEIINAVDAHTAMSNLQPSGVAQAIAVRLLEHWGIPGFLRHVDSIARFYRARRDNFEEKARAILGTSGVASWITPVAGMFLWLKLNIPPSQGEQGEGDSFQLVSEKARAAGVLAVPGTAFIPDGSKTCYVRTSFSLIPEHDVEEAFRRLERVIRQSWIDSGLDMPKPVP